LGTCGVCATWHEFMKKFMKKKHRAPKKHSWLKKIGVKGNYVFKMVCSIMYTPNWRGRKMRESDGIGWNWFHHVPLHSIHFLNIQTMESHLIPLHSIPFHLIPPIQTTIIIIKKQLRSEGSSNQNWPSNQIQLVVKTKNNNNNNNNN
jgi:hypothetical protein